MRINRFLSEGVLPWHCKAKRTILVQSLPKSAKLDPTVGSSRTSGRGCGSASCLVHQDSCMCPSSSNEGDEEDFHYGALIDRANQRKLLSQKSEKVTTAFVRVIKNWVVYHRTSKCHEPSVGLTNENRSVPQKNGKRSPRAHLELKDTKTSN